MRMLQKLCSQMQFIQWKQLQENTVGPSPSSALGLFLRVRLHGFKHATPGPLWPLSSWG